MSPNRVCSRVRARSARCGLSRRTRDGSGFRDDLIEQRAVDGAGNRFDRAVGLHDRHGGLERHIEAVVDDAGIVAYLRKCQTVLVDEPLKRVIVTSPCDSDEVDGVTELDCCLLDRGGFTIAGASSGSPEPEHRWLASQGGGVEVAATDEWGAELQHRGGGGCITFGKIGDRIAMLHGGEIIWAGPKDAIDYSDNEYVNQFIHGRTDGPIKMAMRR